DFRRAALLRDLCVRSQHRRRPGRSLRRRPRVDGHRLPLRHGAGRPPRLPSSDVLVTRAVGSGDRRQRPESVWNRHRSTYERREEMTTSPQRDGIGLAVIGCGTIGRVRARLAREYAGVRWLGLCDVDAEAAEALGRDTNADFVTTDMLELLARPE